MYFLGLDLGSSFIKASIIDGDTQITVGSATVPDQEMAMIAHHPGWAEQNPDQWWSEIKNLILKVVYQTKVDAQDISAIGISYQMHGLVLIDRHGRTLRPSIIWCDSRAVDLGEAASQTLGEQYALEHLLNSPGNFTASKLRWVILNEPHIAGQIHAFMLPGDFINFKLTGDINDHHLVVRMDGRLDVELQPNVHVVDRLGNEPGGGGCCRNVGHALTD